MSDAGFLLDEHIPPIIQARLIQQEPRLRVFAVGDKAAPERGTPDGDLLHWIEENRCMLVTNNRATIPVHLEEHMTEGRHVPGIVQLPRRINMNVVLEDLLLIWTVGGQTSFRAK